MAREAWASAALLRDELSSTVLTLNLRGTPVLDWAADAGEPCVLPLRQLIRNPPGISAPSIRICENRTVLAAAADVHGDFDWGRLAHRLRAAAPRPVAALELYDG
ncbi:hypothetical protein GCM10017778_39260 [Streptomyces vinaceus]|nr:hypothetical protein [Streptomyces vinaceus]GHE51230.1 hypothetical protein GCM10017778_39260 [Streptomyces vinaceus]